MALIAVGVVNVETTLPVEGLPLAYEPVRYPRNQMQSRAAGVGFNVAAALSSLGDDVRLAGYLGDDALGEFVSREQGTRGLAGPGLQRTSETPQSVVLTTPDGRRSVFTDLKNLPDQIYSPSRSTPCLMALTSLSSPRSASHAPDFRRPVSKEYRSLHDLA